ncbi:MAG TPA: sulfurtransferase TusA family protein [Candidatus Hodarchaeales archaeon]|nr:sulfurtransferase TusA family protein [Candidatus Hodarchaeales archaeon]
MPEVKATKVIDARGSYCPGPLMALIKEIKKGNPEEVFEVWSADEGSKKDIPAWATKASHEIVAVVSAEGYTRFQIRKKARLP